jgi:LCP family protein required for cell wall assembly
MTTDEARAPEHVASGPHVPPTRRTGHALRRALVASGVLVVVLTAVLAGGLFFLEDRYAGNIHRVNDVFSGLQNRPAPPSPTRTEAGQPVTWLVMGSDTRTHPSSGTTPSGRSDVIMIIRLSGDQQHVQVVSIPRDSWVTIPGHGVSKINAAYAWGGPSLLIQTVEQLTGVRIDHYAAIDFDGITRVTDELGGVDVMVGTASSYNGYSFHPGLNHLDGVEAQAYLRDRKDLPGGDFDREKRHQQYLRSMFQKLFSAGTFTNPATLDPVLRTVTSAVSVDSGLSNNDLLSMALAMRNTKPSGIAFFTAPVLGTGMEGAASVVYLDTTRDARMWEYLKTDSLGQNADEFKAQELGAVPR